MNEEPEETEEMEEDSIIDIDFTKMDWNHYSDTYGIKGEIKEQVDDFIVKELASHDTGEGDHLIVKLRKQNMTTMDAVDKLSKMLHISRNRIGYAGNKDKRAVTEQYVSIQGVEEEEVRNVYTDEFDIEVIGKGGKIGLGNLSANRFEITVRNLKLPADDIKDRSQKIVDELGGKMPNYFGEQRFGSARPITHQVGRLILKGDFEEAVWTYIAKPYDEEYKSIRKVREELWETREVEGAAERFPEKFQYEKTLLYHLTKNPGDYQGAIKRLPEGLQTLFVHAYQSWIFNRTLSRLIEEDWYDEEYEIPLVGYKTEFNDNKPDEVLQEVMEEEEVDRDDFRLPEVPELASEGSLRRAFADFRNFKVAEVEEDDLNMAKNKMRVRFDLPKGCYATVFLREIMKN
ncbi:tRNA pseudouridine(13) synthase TruD [Candidatus Nanohalobium constans]|uniref:Probable tRNA pseudouridine synthase D n=1 Tax=Candidatus Nanohalobium constans TaxID=2565781 RepID=A0A5Q0UEY1_9ARCH|nr:tRNA pseudouridine(13) synthase TruD [Candidatus Nanohalobium constans]QGA80108.1 tRNA pseudouridine13 synthase [Candidatus Nanohalobium constans]